MNIRRAVQADLNSLIMLFKKAYEGFDHIPDSEFILFQKELKASFDRQQIYRISFFVLEKEEGEIISFAGIAPSMFMGNAWELRWDTTHPDHQRQGLMTELTQYRINFAIEQNAQSQLESPGVIQVMARYPMVYKKFGFRDVWERAIDNYAMYMIREI